MRTVTEEERQVILEHPELVMFHAGRDKTDVKRGGLMLVIPAVIAVFGPIPLCFTSFAEAHPNLVVIISLLWVLVVICVSVPAIMHYDELRRRKSEASHNINILKKALPKDLVVSVVTIKYIEPQQAEGVFIEEGEEKYFGYASCKNYIPLIPDSKVAIIRAEEDFFAFVKRDAVTESLFYEPETVNK